MRTCKLHTTMREPHWAGRSDVTWVSSPGICVLHCGRLCLARRNGSFQVEVSPPLRPNSGGSSKRLPSAHSGWPPEFSTVAMSHGWQEDTGGRRRVARVGVDVRVVQRRGSHGSCVGWRRRRRCIGWRRTECRSWRRWRGAHLVGWQSHGRSRRQTRLGRCGRCGRGRRGCGPQRRKPGRSRGSRQRARMRRRARRRQLRAAGMTGRASPIPRCACAKCPIFAMGSTSLVGAAIREAVQQCRSVPKHAPRRRDT